MRSGVVMLKPPALLVRPEAMRVEVKVSQTWIMELAMPSPGV
jgi:hypothetical protein